MISVNMPQRTGRANKCSVQLRSSSWLWYSRYSDVQLVGLSPNVSQQKLHIFISWFGPFRPQLPCHTVGTLWTMRITIDPIKFPKFLHVLTLELKWFQCKQMRQALDKYSPNFSDKLIKMAAGPAFVIFSARQASQTDITVRVVGCSVCFLCFFWSFSWSGKYCNFSCISPTESSWHGWSRGWLGKQKRPLRKGFSYDEKM